MSEDVNLEQAARHFAEVWSELIGALPDDYDCHMTCAEAEAARQLFTATGHESTAAWLMKAHSEHDEPGDQHYTDRGQT